MLCKGRSCRILSADTAKESANRDLQNGYGEFGGYSGFGDLLQKTVSENANVNSHVITNPSGEYQPVANSNAVVNCSSNANVYYEYWRKISGSSIKSSTLWYLRFQCQF